MLYFDIGQSRYFAFFLRRHGLKSGGFSNKKRCKFACTFGDGGAVPFLIEKVVGTIALKCCYISASCVIIAL